MDQNERLDRIDELRREIDEGEERIRQRQEQRERDLIAMDDHLRSEREYEAQRRAPVQREAPTDELLYRRQENALQPAPNEGDYGVSEADWRAEVAQALGEVAFELKCALRQERDAELVKRDRQINELKCELAEIRGMLGAALQLLGQKPKLWTP